MLINGFVLAKRAELCHFIVNKISLGWRNAILSLKINNFEILIEFITVKVYQLI